MCPSPMKMRMLRMTLMQLWQTCKYHWKEGQPTSTASTSSPFQVYQITWNIWGIRILLYKCESTQSSKIIVFYRPKRFTLKGYKRHFFVLRELQLTSYRSEHDSQDYSQASSFTVNLKGCEVTPDVNIANKKYGIKLAVPSAEGMSDLWLRCESVSLRLVCCTWDGRSLQAFSLGCLHLSVLTRFGKHPKMSAEAGFFTRSPSPEQTVDEIQCIRLDYLLFLYVCGACKMSTELKEGMSLMDS